MTAVLMLGIYAAGVVLVGAAARFAGRQIERRWLLLLAALPLLYLWPAFFSGRPPIPMKDARTCYPWASAPLPVSERGMRSLDFQDVALQIAPWTKAARMAWSEGSLPLRNRWNGCGMALAANAQSAPFSLFFFAALPVPLEDSFALAGALKLLLALCGMFLWLAGFGLSSPAKLLGSLAFAFSLPMTAWLFYPLTSVLCLWPAAFFLLDRLCEPAAARRAFAMLAAVLTAWALGGHPESALLGAIFGAVWFLARLRGVDRERARRALFGAAGAAVVAAGLSMFLLLPESYAVRASNRRAENEVINSAGPSGPHPVVRRRALLTLLFPRIFGDAIDVAMLPEAENQFQEMGAGYFGIVAWAVALTAIGVRSHRAAPLRALVILFSLGVLFGTGIWPFRTLLGAAPLLHLMSPLRFRVWVTVAGAAIAAVQVDRLRLPGELRPLSMKLALNAALLCGLAAALFRKFSVIYTAPGALASEKEALAVVFVSLGLLLAAALVAAISGGGDRAASRLVLACALLCGSELVFQASRFYSYGPASALFPETPLVAYLKSRTGTFRVAGEQAALFPSTNVFVPVEDIRTHDPAEDQRYAKFLEGQCGVARAPYYKFLADVNCPALDFLNVRYLVTDPGHSLPGGRWNKVYSGRDGTVFENGRFLPRIFSPPEIAETSNREELSAPLDFARRALVAREDERTPPSFVPGTNPELRIGAYRETTNEITFESTVAGDAPSIAVASFVNDGGWRAVDETGRKLPILHADGPFLGLVVPSGRHAVHLSYRPPGFRVGAAVSAATAVLLLAGLGILTKGRPRRS